VDRYLSSNNQSQAASTDTVGQDDFAGFVATSLHVVRQVAGIDRLQMPLAGDVAKALADDIVGFGGAQPTAPEVVDGGR
jgi:hypothetical protein